MSLPSGSRLVTKGENLGLQGGTGSKTRGYQSQKCDEKRVAHGLGYGLTKGRKLCVFRLDGVFGTDTQSSSSPLGKVQERSAKAIAYEIALITALNYRCDPRPRSYRPDQPFLARSQTPAE